MKKIFTLLFTLLFFSVTMFAQEAKTYDVLDAKATRSDEISRGGIGDAMLAGDGLLIQKETKSKKDILLKERNSRAATGRPALSSENQRAGTVFAEGFETAEVGALPDGWTESIGYYNYPWFVLDDVEIGDYYMPYEGTQLVINPWDDEIDRDTWMFSPGFTLTAGTSYTVSFWAIMGYEEDDGDSFEVKLAQTASVAAMNGGIEVYRTTNGYYEDWTEITYTFTAASTGTFYLGFHAFTLIAGGYDIVIDDITVTDNTPFDGIDVELAQIITPNSGNNLTNAEQVKVLIKNNGADPITGFTLKLELDNVEKANVTYSNTINGGAQTEYTFATALDLSAAGTYQVKVTATLADDDVPENNSVTKSVTNTVVSLLALPWTEEFEDATFPPAGWTRYATNFTRYTTGGRTQPACFGYGLASSSYPTYGITTPPFISVNGAYLSFWTKVGDAYAPSASYYNTYRIKVSTTDNAQASFTTIKEYSNFAYAGIHSNNVIYTASSGVWHEMTADLSAYAGQIIYVAIEVYDHYGDDNISIDDVGAYILPDNDLAISPRYQYTQVPLSQAPTGIPAMVSNKGLKPQTNVTLTVDLNGTVFGPSTPVSSIAPEATATLTVNTPDSEIQLGANTLIYTVNQDQADENPANNTATINFTGTTGLYACDGVPETLPTGGVGFTGATGTLGNIFEIYNVTSLKQVIIGMAGAGTQVYGLSLYKMNGDLYETDPLFSITATRVGSSYNTVDVPTTILFPGKYFLVVSQTSTTNIGIAFDANPNKVPYSLSTNNTLFTQSNAFGALAIRMVTAAVPDVDLQAVSITGNPTPIASEADTYTVNVSNVGLLTANNYRVSILTEDDEELGFVNVTTPLALGANIDVPIPLTFIEDQVGILKIKGRVEITGDEGPANNETSLLELEILTECTPPLQIVSIGSGTVSSYYYPVNYYYGSCYTQIIYKAEELGGPGMIGSLAFQYSGTQTGTKANQTIYLANSSTKSVFANTSDWLPHSEFQQVFTGSITYDAPGYITVDFNEPFEYTGEYLVVAFLNNLANYGDGMSWTFNNHPTTEYLQMSRYVDGVALNPESPGAAGSSGWALNRGNIQFKYAGTRELTLNPNNVLGPGAVITLEPIEELRCGNSTAYFFSNDACYYVSDVKFDGVSQGNITSYNFDYEVLGTNVLPVIEVVTTKFEYNITATHGENGTIDPVGNVSVKCGEQIIFNFMPDLGYTLDQVIFNGEIMNLPATVRKWTCPVIADAENTLHVTFRECPYSIDIAFDPALGSVFFRDILEGEETLLELVPGPFGTDEGVMYNFIFVPDAVTSDLSAVYVDGALKSGAVISQSYMFSPIFENHTLDVVFTLKQYTIVATAGVNGSINPVGNITVTYGDTPQFNFTPNVGYVIDQVFVDQAPVAANESYVFESIGANHTIHVTFKKESFVINVCNAGIGGATEPTGPEVTVLYNEHQIFNFIPEEGYQVASVLIDGVSYPDAIPTGSYTFFYVTQPHDICVTFEKIPYPITALINGDGTITDEGTTYVEHGDNKTYTIVPREGYKIANVFVDGVDNLAAVASGQYTFENVREPHTISVITALNTFTITATCGPNGIMNPVGTISVAQGDNKFFTFAPAGTYEIDQVLIDGFQNEEAAVNGAYAFLNITESHTIEVTFKKIIYFFDTQMAGTNGISIDNGPLGIENQTMGITVYSHDNVVYIKNENLIPIQDVSIMDMYGRVVWQGKAQNSITLDVANGIYAVRVMANDQITTTKVPINR